MRKRTFVVGLLLVNYIITGCVSNALPFKQADFFTEEIVDPSSRIEDDTCVSGTINDSPSDDYSNNKSSYIAQPDLSKPFTNGSFTIQEPVYPWNNVDIETAWKMTEHYNKMQTFSDCVFLDFTDDDVPEMLLICGWDRIFYIFEKGNDTISLIAKSQVDSHISNGVILSNPPFTELDFTNDDKDVFYSRDKFTVYKGDNEQKYLIVYLWSGTLGEICEIKSIQIQGNKIIFPVVFRWGLFKELGYDSMNTVMRYQKACEDTYKDIRQEEIRDFIKSLNSATDMNL